MPRSSRSSCGTCRRFPFAADDTLDQSPEKPPLPSARAEVCLRTSSHAVSTLKWSSSWLSKPTNSSA